MIENNNFLKKAFPERHFQKKTEEELEKLGIKPQKTELKPNGEKLEKLNQQLLNAALRGSLKEVKEALDKGANVNAKNNDDETPLHQASWKGNEEIVRLLTQNTKTKLDIKNNENKLALDLAKNEKIKQIIKEEIKKRGLKKK